MTNEACRGVMRGGIVMLLEKDVPFTEGEEVYVTPIHSTPGSPIAILQAMAKSTPLPSEWVDELERLIVEGRRPATFNDPFLDGDDNGEPS